MIHYTQKDNSYENVKSNFLSIKQNFNNIRNILVF